MTEGQLLGEVTALAEQLGLLWHHCGDSRHCHGSKGMPDLIISGEHGVIFAELKTEEGGTSADQDLWLWTLRRGGACIQIWRPSDFEWGVIKLILESIR